MSISEPNITDAEPRAALAGAHRPVRVLAAGESPHQGTLVADGDAVRVLVSDPSVVDWRFSGAEHIAGPVDIARNGDGHSVLLPWCTVRIGVFLARREAAGTPLSAGEWTTLAASMLRGLREAAAHGEDDPPGTWWLTVDGRPVLVLGGGGSGKAEAAELLALAERHGAERGLRRVVDGMRDALIHDLTVSASRAERWERELCDYAAPRALEVPAPDAPAVDAVGVLPRGETVPRRRVRERRSLGEPMRARAAHLGMVLLSRLPRPWRLMPAREGARAGAGAGVRAGGGGRVGRRRMLLVGATVAAVVLAVGMLWPDGGGSQAAQDTAERALEKPADAKPAGSEQTEQKPEPPRQEHESTGQEQEPTGQEQEPTGQEQEPTDQASTPPEEGADPAAAARELLRVLDGCAARPEAPCTALVDGSQVDVGMVLRTSEAGDPELIDDYGDIAVMRLGRPSSREQILVIVRQNGNWLVRDAYDVADQPQ